MSAMQFMEILFGKLPDFFQNEEELRTVWTKVHCIYLNHNRVRRSEDSHASKPHRGNRTNPFYFQREN